MRINRSNSEPSGAQQPAVQPQTAAPQQPAPRREEPRQEPPKPKKEKPKKRPEPEEYEAYEEDEEEKPRRRFPVGCLIVLVILALVGFGGYKVSQFYAELDGQGTLGEVQTITVPEGSSVSSIATQLKDSGVIQYDWLFKQYVKYSGKAGEIQYGSFEVQSGMAYNEIIKALSVVTRRPTVNVTSPRARPLWAWPRSLSMPALWRMWTPSCPAPTAPMARTGASMISGTLSRTMAA